MRWTVIQGGSLQDTPLRGGSGSFRTLLTKLGRDGALLWRAGIFNLVNDTSLPTRTHYDHVFMPLSASAGLLELALRGREFEPCREFAPISVAGEGVAALRVKAPVRAFDLIADRRVCRTEVEVLRLEAGDPVEAPDAPEVLIHCLEGEISTAGDLVEAGDSLLGPGPASPAAASTDAVAIVVAVRPATPS